MNERIFELLAMKGLKMQYLAASLGVKDSRVYDWKRGKSSPTPEEFGNIAKLLDTTPEYLQGDTDIATPVSDAGMDELTWNMLDGFRELSDDDKREMLAILEVKRKIRGKR